MHRYSQEKGQKALLPRANEDTLDGWRTESQISVSREKQTRSRHLRPAMADCWLDWQHGGWAALSSANIWPLVRVCGEKVRSWLGVWERVCDVGMSGDLEEGCWKARVGLPGT